MKKNRWIGVGIVVLTGTLALGCGAGQAESGQSSEELKLVSIEKGTEESTVSRQNENIVCLPNKIVVTVTESDAKGVDGFAQ